MPNSNVLSPLVTGSNCRPKEKLLMMNLRIKSATYDSSCHCAADILSSFFSIV